MISCSIEECEAHSMVPGCGGGSPNRRDAGVDISTRTQPSVPHLRRVLDRRRGTRGAAPLHVAIVENEKADIPAARAAPGRLGDVDCVPQRPRAHVAWGRGRSMVTRSFAAHGNTSSLAIAYTAPGARGRAGRPNIPGAGRPAHQAPEGRIVGRMARSRQAARDAGAPACLRRAPSGSRPRYPPSGIRTSKRAPPSGRLAAAIRPP